MIDFSIAGSQYIQSINPNNFDEFALALFRYQYDANELYRSFVDALNVNPLRVTTLEQIPCLPVSFFKTHRVKTGDWHTAALIFESSGTTGEVPARHYVKDAALYEAALVRGFEEVYGAPENYAILALLPSYLERGNASLVHMASVLLQRSGHADGGFYLNEWNELAAILKKLDEEQQPTILLGVTFALLDFAEALPLKIPGIKVMETGGMKGRREEWTRSQVHQFLKDAFRVENVHSEYGMTELLSQAYAVADGYFRSASTMKVMVREINDPLEVSFAGSGCVNIIDLANVHSCAFIATDDIATLRGDGCFEVLGRADFSALRGCSLMTA